MKRERAGAVRGRVAPRSRERLIALPQAFENKAGHYELSRIDGETAYYAFTNRHGQRAEATMTVMCWRRLHERAQEHAGRGTTQGVLGSFILVLALATALPCRADQASASVKPAIPPEAPPTRSITLPGSAASEGQPQPDRPQDAGSENGKPKPAPAVVAASQALRASSGDPQAEAHYRTAVLALKTEDLAVAAEEMNEAAQATPGNALVLYGLAVVQARNGQPEPALANLEKALQAGLPAPESARAPDLLAAIRYAAKKDEDEQKKITPVKLWGSYEAAVEDPVQEFEDRGGKTIFKTRTPLSRELFLWKVDGEFNVRGHWLERETVTEEVISANPRRHDPKPKTTTQEHWWLVTILINADGSLDGSRLQTCTREPNLGCELNNRDRGKVIAFKGRVEPNGDLTLTQDEQILTMKKKSRVASLPPPEVHIQLD